ncbi:hypothetical protein DYB32_001408 [Aphanomyces invadans]|uniref:WW domain-containing protein n=1 Tax=Aphanomyces invadans TaxID=157072 RepID=A0A3R6YEW3_9STRA|nr:hypothetical protein DYB32_001408 [Aphanomyces invadans]
MRPDDVTEDTANNDESGLFDGTTGTSNNGPGAVSPWLPFVDEASGATYYYNQETQELSWTDPASPFSHGCDDTNNDDRPFPEASSRPGSASLGATQITREKLVGQGAQPTEASDSVNDWPFSAIDHEFTSSASARGDGGGALDGPVETEEASQVELRPTSSHANVLLERNESRGVSSMLETDDDDGGDILALHDQMIEHEKAKAAAQDSEVAGGHDVDSSPTSSSEGIDAAISVPEAPQQHSSVPAELNASPLTSATALPTTESVQIEPTGDSPSIPRPNENGAQPLPVERPEMSDAMETKSSSPTAAPPANQTSHDEDDAVVPTAAVPWGLPNDGYKTPITLESAGADGIPCTDTPEGAVELNDAHANSPEVHASEIPAIATGDSQVKQDDPMTAAVPSAPLDVQISPQLKDEVETATNEHGAATLPLGTEQRIASSQSPPESEDAIISPERVATATDPPHSARSSPTPPKSRPATAESSGATAAKDQPAPDPAPSSWVEAYDADRGLTYYYDPATKAVSWDHPGGLEKALVPGPFGNFTELPGATTLTADAPPPARPSLSPRLELGATPQLSTHAPKDDILIHPALTHAAPTTSCTDPFQPSDSIHMTKLQPSLTKPSPRPQSAAPTPDLELHVAQEAASIASRPTSPSPPLPLKPSTPTLLQQQRSRRRMAEAARTQAWARDVASWQRLYNEASNQYHALVEQMQEAVATREAAVAREAGDRDMRKRQFAALLSHSAIEHLSPWEILSRNLVGVDLKRVLQEIIDEPAKHPDVLPSSACLSKPAATPAVVQQELMRVRNEVGDSLLHLAVWKGSLVKVKHLLSLGADVNLVDNSITQWTPLHEAARSGNVSITKLLLSAGAAIAATDASGDTALHWACRANHSTIVKVLLHADPAFATLSTINHKRKTPLDLAKKPTLRRFLQGIERAPLLTRSSLASSRKWHRRV